MKRSVAYTIAGFAIINLILIIVSVATSAWLTFSGRGVFSLWQSGKIYVMRRIASNVFIIMNQQINFIHGKENNEKYCLQVTFSHFLTLKLRKRALRKRAKKNQNALQEIATETTSKY